MEASQTKKNTTSCSAHQNDFKFLSPVSTEFILSKEYKAAIYTEERSFFTSIK